MPDIASTDTADRQPVICISQPPRRPRRVPRRRASGLPTDARGTVDISPWLAADNTTVTMEAEVDCLVTGDRTATFTAVVTGPTPRSPTGSGSGWASPASVALGADADARLLRWLVGRY
jgi:hypothetical protein